MGRGRSGAKKKGGGGFRPLTDKEESAMYASQNITPELQDAFDKYTDPNTLPGSLYNYSQEMNSKVAQGIPLSPDEQATWDAIEGSMHDLGKNVMLTRYDHADTVQEMLNKIGVRGNAETMTAKELSDALVGVGYKDKRILSTSVNGFANADNPEVFTTRQFKFSYEAKPGTQAVLPGVGKVPHVYSSKSTGDDFGEALLGSSNSYSIKAVRSLGTKGRSKGMPTYVQDVDQIEIVVEVG